MRIIHNGVKLSHEQQDIIRPVIIDSIHGRIVGIQALHSAIDKALADAGCPAIAPSADEKMVSPDSEQGR